MSLPPYPIPAGVVTPCMADAELMFADSKSAPRKLERAKKVCNSGDAGAPCPYRDGCLAWALTRGEEGVWAGTDEKERRRICNEQGIRPVRPPTIFPRKNASPNSPHPAGTAVGVEKHRKRYEPLCDECFAFDVERAAS